MFDCGNTVFTALRAYERQIHPFTGDTDPMSAGGGLMRLAPAIIAASKVDDDFARETTRLHWRKKPDL